MEQDMELCDSSASVMDMLLYFALQTQIGTLPCTFQCPLPAAIMRHAGSAGVLSFAKHALMAQGTNMLPFWQSASVR